jgi:hypothetical protein
VPGAVEKFESLGDVGNVYSQSHAAGVLPERLPGPIAGPQSLTRKTVYRLAQANMALVL